MAAAPLCSHRGTMAFLSAHYPSRSTTPSVRVIEDPQAFDAFFKEMNINSKVVRELLPAVNFYKEIIVMVAMGYRNSDGYKLSFDTSKAIDVFPDHIAMQVVWTEPPPGTATNPTPTHPFVLVQMPRGEYHRIKIFDQSKRLRYVSNLTP